MADNIAGTGVRWGDSFELPHRTPSEGTAFGRALGVATHYVLTEYRRRPFATVRMLLVLSVVMAIAFFLASFWPAKDFAATATYEHACYDLSVNGPLRRVDVARIRAVLPATALSVPVFDGNLTAITGGGPTIKAVPAMLYPRAHAREVALTYFSRAMLLGGSMDAPGAAGIDVMTAQRLGVGIGNTLRYEQQIDANPLHNIRGSVRITAIYAPTDVGSGVIVPLSPQLGRVLSGGNDVIASDLFIRSGSVSPDELAAKIAGLKGGENWNVNLVNQQLSDARKSMSSFASRTLRAAMVAAALLVYAIVVVREQFARIERRRRDIAIMLSLGEPLGRMCGVFVFEQAVITVLTTVVGVWFVDYVLGHFLFLYVADSARLTLVGLAVGVNIVVIALAWLYLHVRIGRLPVTRVLAAE